MITTKYTEKRDGLREQDCTGDGHYVAATQVCPGQDVNQDSCLILDINAETTVLAIADGAGGYSNGAVASTLMINTLERNVHEWADKEDLRVPIIKAIEECNSALLKQTTTSATTVVIAEIQGNTVRHYLVGDSSIFLVGQKGAMRLQSVPQSVVGYGIESGFLAENATQTHEDRHLVLNLVGIKDMKIELGPTIRMRPRDTLLICSDGLTDNMLLADIVETIRSGPIVKKINVLLSNTKKIMQSENGHEDDVTIVAYRPNA